MPRKVHFLNIYKTNWKRERKKKKTTQRKKKLKTLLIGCFPVIDTSILLRFLNFHCTQFHIGDENLNLVNKHFQMSQLRWTKYVIKHSKIMFTH